MKILTFFLTWATGSYLMGACTCGSPVPKAYGVDISYRNKKGESLLDTNTTGHYNIDSVRICGVSLNSDNFRGASITYFLNTTTNKCVITLRKTINDTLSWTF
jgi:hypothetical protein